MPDDSPETLFGSLTKYGAIGGGIAYVFGVLTISIYLHAVGIIDFSFAKPKLILTGVLVVLTFVLLALLPAFGVECLSLPRPRPKSERTHSKRIISLLLFPLVLLVAASGYFSSEPAAGLGQIAVWQARQFFGLNHGDGSVWSVVGSTVLLTAKIYVPVCVATVFGFLSASLFGRAKSILSASGIVPESVYFVITVALTVVSVVIYIYYFSITLYPAIPTEFGGGAPYYESLAVKDSTELAGQIGIPFIAKTGITCPLPIVHESDSLIAVWKDVPNQRPVVIQLQKTEIVATRAEKGPEQAETLTACQQK